jgi:hypothetical protein
MRTVFRAVSSAKGGPSRADLIILLIYHDNDAGPDGTASG